MQLFRFVMGVVAMLLCLATALPTTGDTQSDKSIQVAASADGAAETSSKVEAPTNGTTQVSKRNDEYTEGIWGCAKRGWSDYCQHWHSDDIHMCHSTAFDRDQTYGFESWNPDPGMACVMYANSDCTGKLWGEGYWGFWAHDTDEQTLKYPYFKSLSFRCAPCANPNPGCDWKY